MAGKQAVKITFANREARDRFLEAIPNRRGGEVPGFYTVRGEGFEGIPGVSVGVFCDRVTLYLADVDGVEVEAENDQGDALAKALRRFKDAAVALQRAWEHRPGDAIAYPRELPDFDTLASLILGMEVRGNG
jgi:hypothetical protein